MSFFSLSFLSFLFVISLPRFVERVLAQLTEKDREAHKAQKQRVSREKERDLFALLFFFFLQKRALYYLFIKSIYISQK